MAISTAELVGKVKDLQQTSEQLARMIELAAYDLSKSAAVLSELTRGSRSGEEATGSVRTAADSLDKAASSLKALDRACDEFIQNAVR